MDAIVAVAVMECSMQSSALLGGVNILHSAFPEDPDMEYLTQSMCTPAGLGQLLLIRTRNQDTEPLFIRTSLIEATNSGQQL